MNFGNLMPARSLKGATCAAALAASVALASGDASAQLVLNGPQAGALVGGSIPAELTSSSSATTGIVLNEPIDGTVIDILTPGGAIPSQLLRAASASAPLDADSVSFFVYIDPAADVEFPGTLIDAASGEWDGTVDLVANAPATSPFSVFVDAAASVPGYYADSADIIFSNVAEITVNVGDSAAVDPNGDGSGSTGILTVIPAAGSKISLEGTGSSGSSVVSTFANVTGDAGGGVEIDATAGGVTAIITPPSQNELSAAYAAAGDATTAALVASATDVLVTVTASTNAGDLTTPAGDSPGAALGGSPLGGFIRVVYILVIAGEHQTLEVDLPAGALFDIEFTTAEAISDVFQYVLTILFGVNTDTTSYEYTASGDWIEADSSVTPSTESLLRVISVYDNEVDATLAAPSSIVAFLGEVAGSGDDDDDDDDGGTCFIATAAYGTPMAHEINTLRDVRDSYMLNNVLGSVFVDTYYRLSPAVADKVAESPALAAVVRAALTPFILLGKAIMAAPMAVVAFLMAGAGLVLAHRKTRGQQS